MDSPAGSERTAAEERKAPLWDREPGSKAAFQAGRAPSLLMRHRHTKPRGHGRRPRERGTVVLAPLDTEAGASLESTESPPGCPGALISRRSVQCIFLRFFYCNVPLFY